VTSRQKRGVAGAPEAVEDAGHDLLLVPDRTAHELEVKVAAPGPRRGKIALVARISSDRNPP
jgi:hypothetical protein